MAVESSPVVIRITVTDANSGAVIGEVEANLQKLGAAGTTSGQKVKKGMEEIGVAGMKSKEQVHLFTEEFGIHMPRSFRTLIAENKTLMSGIRALSGVMMGVAAIQIGVMVGEEAFRAIDKYYDKWISLKSLIAESDTVVKDFGQHAAEAMDRQAVAMEHLISVTQGEAAAKQFKLSQLQNKPINLAERYGSKEYTGLPDEVKGDFEKITGESVKPKDLDKTIARLQTYEQTLKNTLALERAAKNPGVLAGPYSEPQLLRMKKLQESIKIGQSITDDLLNQKGAFDIEEKALQADIDKAGKDKNHSSESSAAREEKAPAQELARVREQALEATLTGTALWQAKEEAAIREVQGTDATAMNLRSAIHEKFHNEEEQRLRQEQAQSELSLRNLREQTELEGLTGVARIRKEGDIRVTNLTEKDPGARLAATYEIGKQTDFAAAAEAKKEADEQKKTEADTLAAQQRAAQETTRIEEQARVRSLSAEKKKTAAIQAEYDERLQKYNEELTAQQISQDDFDRRKIAAAQERDAEIAEASKAAQDKMAGEFTGFFRGMKNPSRYFAEMGDKAAGKSAAALWQHFASKGKGAEDQEGNAGGAGGFFGDLKSQLGFGKKAKVPGLGADAKAEHSGGHTAAQGVFSVTSATIHIGNASFAGVGGGAGSGIGSGTGSISGPGVSAGGAGSISGPGAGIGPGGSTALMAPGSAGASGGVSAGSTGAPGSYAGGSGGAGDAGATTAQSVISAGSTAAGASKGKAGGVLAGIAGTGKTGYDLYKQTKSYYANKAAGHDAIAKSNADAAQLQPSSYQANGQFNEVPQQQLKVDKNGNLATSSSDTSGDAGSNWSGSWSSSDRTSGNAGAGSGANWGQNGSSGSSSKEKNIDAVAGPASGVWAAHESGGGASGALQGSASGAQVGMEFGGPIGAIIGGVAGAIIGAIGTSGPEKKYDKETVKPRIAADKMSYDQGGMDYMTAYSDAESLMMESQKTLHSMGHNGTKYFNNTIQPEIKQFMASLSAQEKAGRSNYSSSAAQYDIGTDSVPHDGFAMIHAGERIIPSDQNERLTTALEGGGKMPVQSQSMGDVHLHVHAIDAKGVAQFMGQYKHHIRAALNDSYAENSGGGLN
jgi:hypothetical protein